MNRKACKCASPLDTAKSRQEKSDRVTNLYVSGFTQQQVASMLGLSYSYVNSLINDPTGAEEDRRKRKHHGVCVDCGAHTFNGGARNVPKRCQPCAKKYESETQTIWTREACIAGIQGWAALHGEPPKATDWLKQVEGSPGQYIKGPRAEWVGKRRWPTVQAIQREFGSWSNGLEAAGFTRRENYERTDEWKESVTKWTRERILVALNYWKALHGKYPSSYEWRTTGGQWPSYTSVHSKFPLWADALA
ncbi:MAG TPA: hypothetical protein VJ837_05310, partial [Candidatus Paceibacterota bacterium]|nr:hypothetical protein [Candidatus Paceibacterota bacterium]